MKRNREDAGLAARHAARALRGVRGALLFVLAALPPATAIAAAPAARNESKLEAAIDAYLGGRTATR